MINYMIIAYLLFELMWPTHETGSIDTYNWKFHFPESSSMGIFLAVAIPLDLPNKRVFLAYNFEANYGLPSPNFTAVEYPPLVAKSGGRKTEEIPEGETKTFRGMDRKLVYDVMESKLNSHGYPGRACLLRTICETTLHSVTETNGVIGDIFHIIFTPTSSKNYGIVPDYESAEKHGRKIGECASYHKNCSISLLDLVSLLGNAL